MEQELDLRELVQILMRRLWLIILIPLVATATAGYISYYELTPIYQASATVWVKGESGMIDYGSIMATQSITKTYAEVVRSYPVAAAAAQRLNQPDVTPEVLQGQISADPLRDTQLVRVTVTDTDPDQAALKANAVVEAFKEEIEETQMVEHIQITDRARAPAGPIQPRPRLNMALAAVLGLMAAVGLAFLLEYWDTSVRSASELQRHLGGPILASIPYVDLPKERSERRRRPGEIHPIVVTHADYGAPAAEAYRILRTNIQFLALDRPLRSILITSAEPEEGKSVTSVNLAVALAQAGARVCLIDADLRRPTVAKLLGLTERRGLTGVLVGELPLEEVLQESVAGLQVLTCGPIPPNPSELLGSSRMAQVLRDLEAQFDFVVIDTPPTLVVADAAALAPHVGGVVQVVRAGMVGVRELMEARDSLLGVKANLLGHVLKGVRKKPPYYYHYYYQPGNGWRKEKTAK